MRRPSRTPSPSNWKVTIHVTNAAAAACAASAATGCRARRRRHASPMMPLESSARAMTFIAEASAFVVTGYTCLGSVDAIDSSRMSTASCIRAPWALDARQR